MEQNINTTHIIACIKRAFSTLNPAFLNELNEDVIYSNLDKEGIIDDLSFKIEKVSKDHSPPLHIIPGKCSFCYPEGTAIKFVDPDTEEMAIQFVIAQEGSNEYRIEQCKNNPIPETDNGLPF